jgi:hypothetical protein
MKSVSEFSRQNELCRGLVHLRGLGEWRNRCDVFLSSRFRTMNFIMNGGDPVCMNSHIAAAASLFLPRSGERSGIEE